MQYLLLSLLFNVFNANIQLSLFVLYCMILKGLDDDADNKAMQEKGRMVAHRTKFDKYKQIINRFEHSRGRKLADFIGLDEINQEKQMIIKDLDQLDAEADEDFQFFEELAFYQQRYLELLKELKAELLSGSPISDPQLQNLKANFCKDMRVSMGVYELEQTNNNKKSSKKDNRVAESAISSSENTSQQPFTTKANYAVNKVKYQSIKGNGITKPIFQFFQKKQKGATKNFRDIKIKPQRSKSPVSSISANRSVKKVIKKPAHTVQIQKLLEQNKRLYRMLENRRKEEIELNQFEKNILREERQGCMKRIEQLEQEVEQLERNNFRLKHLEGQKSKNNPTICAYEDSYQKAENNYEPYSIPVRHNDLARLSSKIKQRKPEESNEYFDMLDIPPILKDEKSMRGNQKQDFIRDPNNQSDFILNGLLTENDRNNTSRRFGTSIDRGSNFEQFSIANTAYNNSSLFLNASKNLVAIDGETSTRNKVAFFKKSMVIVKDQQFQIAFKKSNLDSTMSKIRIIFYINNKTSRTQPVKIQYDYEFTHYQLHVTEKLTSISGRGQGREVLEIQLADSCPDLNSVMDLHIKLGNRNYDLWVPVTFLEFVEAGSLSMSKQDTSNMIVQPDRQFRSHQLVSKILPLSREVIPTSDESQAYLACKSKLGYFQIALNWWNKELTIETDPAILDFLGFVMHHFK